MKHKKYGIVILCLLVTCLFTACNNMNYSVYYQEKLPGFSDYHDSAVLIKNVDELKDALQLSDFEYIREELIENSKDFNDNFFEDNCVVLMMYITGSGSNVISISNIKLEGSTMKIIVNVERPVVGTADMAGHCFLITFAQKDCSNIQNIVIV